MRKIYLAGPLFTSAERLWNAKLARELEVQGYDIFLPQEHEPRELTAKTIFEADVAGIDDADVVVGIMDGSDPDSGTAWECGYAYAKGKPIILVRTDFRGNTEGVPGAEAYNLMLSVSANANIRMPFGTVEATVVQITHQLCKLEVYIEHKKSCLSNSNSHTRCL